MHYGIVSWRREEANLSCQGCLGGDWGRRCTLYKDTRKKKEKGSREKTPSPTRRQEAGAEAKASCSERGAPATARLRARALQRNRTTVLRHSVRARKTQQHGRADRQAEALPVPLWDTSLVPLRSFLILLPPPQKCTRILPTLRKRRSCPRLATIRSRPPPPANRPKARPHAVVLSLPAATAAHPPFFFSFLVRTCT